MDLLKGVHLKCYGFSHYRFGAKSVKLLRDKLDVYRSGAAHKIYERISGYLVDGTPEEFSKSSSHHDALPPRKSAGVAEAARVTAKVEGVDPPRVVHDFTECAALEDSVPLEDFAADDVLHVGFPKLQDPPPLDPPSE